MLSINCAHQLISSVNPFRGKGDVKCELKILTHDKTFVHFSHKVFCFVVLVWCFFFFPSPPNSRQNTTKDRICNINEKMRGEMRKKRGLSLMMCLKVKNKTMKI